jgi:phospholipase/carboxylesterase
MSINIQEQISCVEINPTVPATKTIIWLHGLGADGHDFTPIVPEMQLPNDHSIRFIFPHAPTMPVTVNQGYVMRAWYDIYELSSLAKVDKAGIANSVKLVNELIEKEISKGISSENIFLAGFSQGAVIALITGLTYPAPLAGVIALSGYFPLAADTLKTAAPANKTLPIFIAHGTEDTAVPYALGEGSYTTLKQAGYAPSLHRYPIAHGVCADEISDISKWIQSVKNKGYTTG